MGSSHTLHAEMKDLHRLTHDGQQAQTVQVPFLSSGQNTHTVREQSTHRSR